MMAGFLDFLKGIFTGPKGAALDGLSVAQAKSAIAELTDDDETCLRLFEAALSGDMPENSPYTGQGKDTPLAVAIICALYGANRLAMVDWAAGVDEICGELAPLIADQGMSVDQLLASSGNRTVSNRGDAVGLVYTEIRKLADQNQRRILSINEGSDCHHFLLTSEAAAERWTSVKIAENVYFEDSDWQFKKQLLAAGFELRSKKHPMDSARSAPAER